MAVSSLESIPLGYKKINTQRARPERFPRLPVTRFFSLSFRACFPPRDRVAVPSSHVPVTDGDS